MTWCDRCELAPAVKKGECETCAKHRQRYGEPRPLKLIEQQKERHFRRLDDSIAQTILRSRQLHACN